MTERISSVEKRERPKKKKKLPAAAAAMLAGYGAYKITEWAWGGIPFMRNVLPSFAGLLVAGATYSWLTSED